MFAIKMLLANVDQLRIALGADKFKRPKPSESAAKVRVLVSFLCLGVRLCTTCGCFV